MLKRRVHSVVVHHTAGSQTETAEQIRAAHKARGWGDIGYHAIVTRAGGIWHVEQGRHLEWKGAHAGRGFPGNLGSIGISVCGNYVNSPVPLRAAEALYEQIFAWFMQLPDLEFIFGHCDLNATACPGNRLYNLIPAIRRSINDGLTCLNFDFERERNLAIDREAARRAFRERKAWARGTNA